MLSSGTNEQDRRKKEKRECEKVRFEVGAHSVDREPPARERDRQYGNPTVLRFQRENTSGHDRRAPQNDGEYYLDGVGGGSQVHGDTGHDGIEKLDIVLRRSELQRAGGDDIVDVTEVVV